MKTRLDILRSQGWISGEKLEGGYYAEFEGKYFENDKVEELYLLCRNYYRIVLLHRIRDGDTNLKKFEKMMLKPIIGETIEIDENEIVTLKIDRNGKFYL